MLPLVYGKGMPFIEGQADRQVQEDSEETNAVDEQESVDMYAVFVVDKEHIAAVGNNYRPVLWARATAVDYFNGEKEKRDKVC